TRFRRMKPMTRRALARAIALLTLAVAGSGAGAAPDSHGACGAPLAATLPPRCLGAAARGPSTAPCDIARLPDPVCPTPAHPQVTTLFQVQITSRKGVLVHPGQDEFSAEVDGYRRAWRTLPRSVKHIIVIRDTPKMVTNTPGCVMRAHRRRERPGLACAR